MSVQVKRRRDTAANLGSFAGAQAELIVDTTNNRVQVHDGVTAGGWPAAKLAEVLTNGRTAVSDADYTVLTTDRSVAYTAITAARSLALPAAADYPTGTTLTIFDESGACSATNIITLSRAGSDTIGGAASASIATAYGYLALQSNGSSKWTILDQWIALPLAIGSGGTSASSAAGARASSGLNIDALTKIADANYTASAADRKIAYASISATRIVTLPAASSLNPGQTLDIIDHYGVCSSSLTLTAQANGTDTINGASSIVAVAAQYGGTTLRADGVSKWSYVPASSSAAGVASLNLLTGALSIAAGTGLAVSASGAAVTLANTSLPGGPVNKFRNATMDVWQRGTSSLTATTSGTHTADGWIVLPTGASVTATQAGGRLLTKCSLQVTGASSVTDLIVKQRIESYIAAALCSQTVTVQAQVYNNTGGAITPLLSVKHAGSQDVWTSPTTDVSAVSLQSCANGAWTQVAYTFSASASSYNGLEISFDFGNNFSTTGKSLQITELDIRVTPAASRRA